MQVLDILTETKKKTNEGPLRYAKRTLGKNTAMGKAAQLDVEIDQEVNDLYKEFYAVTKQYTKNQGMTAKGLANYIAAKGFAGSPSEVMRFINQEQGMTRGMKKGYKSAKKGVKAAAGAAKSGASAVVGAAKKVKDKLAPKKSDLTPDKQMELPLANSMYGESRINEADANLSKSQVKQVLKGFVRKGFQSQLGGKLQKSQYGDADAVANTQSSAKLNKVGVNPEIANAVTLLQKQGYKVITPKSAKLNAD